MEEQAKVLNAHVELLNFFAGISDNEDELNNRENGEDSTTFQSGNRHNYLKRGGGGQNLQRINEIN